MKLRQLLFCGLFACGSLFAQQAGDRDMTFNAIDDGSNGFGCNEDDLNRDFMGGKCIFDAFQQPDGKIIIAGYLDTYNNESGLNDIIRINPDGTRDTTFNVGSGANTQLSSAKLLPSGKILVTGNFTTFNGVVKYSAVVLNQDGTIDPSFNIPYASAIKDCILQADGKILVYGGGDYIARINSDGSEDTTFISPFTTGNFQSIESVLLQNDGKYIVMGTVGTSTAKKILRLNSNGSIDTSFDHNLTGSIFCAALQNDGKIIIGGGFTVYDGVTRNSIARLNTDGSLDTTFNPGTGTIFVRSIRVLSDGKLLITGGFGSYNDTYIQGAARINTDGSLDTTFTASSGTNLTVFKSVLLNDGNLLFVGGFNYYDNFYTRGVAKTSFDGVVDVNFNSANGLDNSPRKIKVLPDGKIMVSGLFGRYNKTKAFSILRLNQDGSPDTTFSSLTNAGLQSNIPDFEVLSDGKILITGSYNYSQTAPLGIVRLNNNGTLDTTFNSGGQGMNNGSVGAVKVLPGGKILIGGSFQSYNAIAKKTVARLNENGTLDTTFTFPSVYPNATVYSLTLQDDGKILAAGQIKNNTDGTICSLIRLNADGTSDSSFIPVSTNGVSFPCVAILSNGKILYGGHFSTVNGVSVPGYVRLNSDGSIDTTFNITQTDNPTNGKACFTVLPNGKIATSAYGGSGNSAYQKLQILSADGTVEYSNLLPITHPNYTTITALAAQADNNIIVGGYFKSYNGSGVRNLMRIYGSNISSFSVNPISSNEFCTGSSLSVSYTATGTFATDNVFTVQLSDALGSFTNPVTIGSTTSAFSGTINVQIPFNTLAGTGYRIRVTRSNNITAPSVNGMDIIIHNTPVPVVESQTFCAGATVSQLEAEGQNLNWYSSIGGNALAGTALLTSGTYYVTQTLNGCESQSTQIPVTVNQTVPPSASEQTFCLGATVSQLEAEGQNLNWYSSISGSSLEGTAVLTSGTYYVTQTLNGCESQFAEVSVTVNQTVPPSVSEQTFCSGATVADLNAEGENLKWYTGPEGTVIPETTLLTTGGYYVTQTINGCESTKAETFVTVNEVLPPTGNSEQTTTDNSTLADLEVEGENLEWYATESGAVAGEDVLPESTAVQDGTTYYVTQTVGECTSEPLAVAVSLILDINDFEHKKISYYPNPVKDTLFISAYDSIQNITVYNLLGQQVINSQWKTSQGTLDTSALASGSYLVKISVGDSEKTIKIIKL